MNTALLTDSQQNPLLTACIFLQHGSIQVHGMRAVFHAELCTFAKVWLGEVPSWHSTKKTCLHLNFSHAMALKLDANVFQYKMNVYKENLIFSLNAYRTWQLAQLGLILKPVISRFRITKLVHTN